MFPLGIIPMLIGITFFAAHYVEQDEINRYLLLIFGLGIMSFAFFLPDVLVSTRAMGANTIYEYGVDSSLAQIGDAFIWLVLIYLGLTGVRVIVAHFWDSLVNFYDNMMGR